MHVIIIILIIYNNNNYAIYDKISFIILYCLFSLDGGVHFVAAVRHVLADEIQTVHDCEVDAVADALDPAFTHVPAPKTLSAQLVMSRGARGKFEVSFCGVGEASLIFEVRLIHAICVHVFPF